MSRVVVLGAGTMGNGIAQVFAQAGHSVTLRDLTQEILGKARAGIEKSLGKLVEKGNLAAPEREATLGRIAFETNLEAAAKADLVVERSFRSLTPSARKTRSSRPTRHRYPSRPSAREPSARTRSSACIS